MQPIWDLRPKLKDNKNKKSYEIYPLGDVPEEINSLRLM